jgi:hypothetical protein
MWKHPSIDPVGVDNSHPLMYSKTYKKMNMSKVKVESKNDDMIPRVTQSMKNSMHRNYLSGRKNGKMPNCNDV